MSAARIVVMGVAGSGKTTVGAALAAELGHAFIDGDDLHPKANVEKMTRGEPLNDADRAPWLDAVGAALGDRAPALIACSALKRAYRARIAAAAGAPVIFVYLDGSKELIGARMAARVGHFMPPALLDSQFAALEPPGADEGALIIGIDGCADAVLARALAALRAAPA